MISLYIYVLVDTQTKGSAPDVSDNYICLTHERTNFMRAIITVIGKDTIGILAKVSAKCAEYNANVIEVTQSIMQDLFCMIMLVDISQLNSDFAKLSDAMQQLGEVQGLKIHTMHEDIFNCMHHI